MSLQYTERIVTLLRQDLVSGSDSTLGTGLDELEDRYLPLSKDIDIDRDDALKSLLITVAKEGANLGKVDISLHALNKIDLNNPLNLLNLSLKSPAEKAELISNYLQIDTGGQPGDPKDRGNGERDEESPEIRAKGSTEQEKHLERARNEEVEEDFREALASFELSGARDATFLRVSIKHMMCASNEFLLNYCRNRPELHHTWLEYLLALGQFDKAVIFCESIGEDVLSFSFNSTKRVVDTSTPIEIHPEILEFVSEDESKWSNIKQLDRLVSLSISLKGERSKTAELITHYLSHNHVPLAMSLAMSLDRANLVLDQFLAQSCNLSIGLNRISSRDSLHANTLHLLHHLSSAMLRDDSPNQHIILSACLELGLVDDFLQLIKSTQNLGEIELDRMIEVVEQVVESGSQEKFDVVDPTLHESTTASIMSLVKQDDRRNINTKLVTINILAIDIYLMKLDTGGQSATMGQSISDLERMFSHLADNLEGLALTASDGLIKSTNNLVIAIKSRLDALADSEIIRMSFIKIVDTVAGLCLIDARYKSAAILYSQIEDNVSAIKALMRTGNAETVMNYALLVRDITATRITINYIKHLRLEPEVIENFIKLSKV